MKKILSEIDIWTLYFQEHSEKCRDLWTVEWVGIVKVFNPDTFHFRKFKIKHFFLNIWKRFLNKVEAKFFPELKAPRFEKKPLWWIVKPEAPKQQERIFFKYKDAVTIRTWFYQWCVWVVLKQLFDSYWISLFKYDVEIITKDGSTIAEIYWDQMTPFEKKNRSCKFVTDQSVEIKFWQYARFVWVISDRFVNESEVEIYSVEIYTEENSEVKQKSIFCFWSDLKSISKPITKKQ